MGAKMKVTGDVKKDAIIIITNEGITNVTSSSKFTRIVVKDGVIQTPEVIDQCYRLVMGSSSSQQYDCCTCIQ